MKSKILILLLASMSAWAQVAPVIYADNIQLVFDDAGKFDLQTILNVRDHLFQPVKSATLVLYNKVDGRFETVGRVRVRVRFEGDTGLQVAAVYNHDSVMTFKRYKLLDVNLRDFLGHYSGLGVQLAPGIGIRAITYHNHRTIALNTMSLQAGLGWALAGYEISLEAVNENDPIWNASIQPYKSWWKYFRDTR